MACRWLQWLKRCLVFFIFLAWACFRAWTSAASASSAHPSSSWQRPVVSFESLWRRTLNDASGNAVASAGEAAAAAEEEEGGKASSDGKLGFTVCASVVDQAPNGRCQYAQQNCRGSNKSNINYVALHYCTLKERSWIFIPLLVLGILASFVFLAETAEGHFSPVARSLVDILHMSPSMGGVTLLALGNGAPDVFGSVAAILGGNPRIGMGAILSAGTFVSAFVVGFVAMVAAPFSVKPVFFIRDVVFYTVSVMLLFSVYIGGIVQFWQAVGLVLFYLVFVLVVIFMDLMRHFWQHDEISHFVEDKKQSKLENFDTSSYVQIWHTREEESARFEDYNLCRERIGRMSGCEEQQINHSHHKQIDLLKSLLHSFLKQLLLLISPNNIAQNMILKKINSPVLKVRALVLIPVRLLLSATIPASDPSQWNRIYTTTSILLCPVALLFMFRAVIPFNHQITLFMPNFQLPLLLLVIIQGTVFACAYYLEMREPPKSTQVPLVFLAFVMSVCWISFIAGELLSLLAALGVVLHVPPSLLGLTVLAWGNSMGDLVADVAVARAGQPEMAVAGCYAGPMFNMLLGLGFALAMHTGHEQSSGYILLYHPSIMIAFGFLFLSLLGSLLVVTYSKFQVTRTWGLCLISLYIIFTVVSLYTASMTT